MNMSQLKSCILKKGKKTLTENVSLMYLPYMVEKKQIG